MAEAPLRNLSFLSMETIIGYMNPEKLLCHIINGTVIIVTCSYVRQLNEVLTTLSVHTKLASKKFANVTPMSMRIEGLDFDWKDKVNNQKQEEVMEKKQNLEERKSERIKKKTRFSSLIYQDPRFTLSIKSDNFIKFVESIKVPVDKILIAPSWGSVYISKYNDHFSIECIEDQDIANEVITGRINGKLMTFYKPFWGGYDYSLETLTLVEMKDFASHLLRIFRPKKLNLRLTASSSIIFCLDWKIPWTKIFIDGTSEYVITWEDVRRVLEYETVTRISLVFEYTNGRRDETLESQARELEVLRQTRASLLDIPKIIKCEKFRCVTFDFISVDDLINSQCKIITLYRKVTPMTTSDLNRLLKAWKTGEFMTNLKEFRMAEFERSRSRTSEILEGIEARNGYPTHNGIYNEISKREIDSIIDMGGLVFKRETDNVLATILMRRSDFYFVVWKDEEQLG